MRRIPLIALLVVAFVGPGPGSTMADEGQDGGVKLNRLENERSPYLRQHQTNPVDWYPWGEEALARAKAEDKPIFLSIGYAACHWCHVMEHESFEDDATAKLLNDAFVCVKVDREERPDLDRIYMTAVQVLTGRGGWPMTVLLFPDGRPFWGGTYYPRETVHQIVGQISALWRDDRGRLDAQANALSEAVRDRGGGLDLPDPDSSDADLLRHMRNAIRAGFDAANGGYGTRPKFPPHTEMLFYLDPGGADEIELEEAERTLAAMEEGGIHDHVGGGFHRYSTDERWFLPHFEKMLYDNALIMQAYAGMYARTKGARYKRVVERTADWLEREMRREGGGYASSLDADTEGEEGLTYTWTPDELEAALGAADAKRAAAVFGFRAGGNFRDESSGASSGRNIVYLPRALDIVAAEQGVEPEALGQTLDGILARMLAVRAQRAQPGLDDKVITAWNALLVSGYVRAGVALESPEYLDRARSLAAFLLEQCRRDDGTLLRFPKGSGPEIVGFCEDYVHLIAGLLDLADATGESAHAVAAEDLARRLVAEYQDADAGGFWTTSAASHETLFARSKEVMDSPIPSDNGVAAFSLLRLHVRTGDEAFETAADRTLAAFRPMLGQPRFASMLVALFRALSHRLTLERTGAAGAVRGDVHLRQDVAQVDVFLHRAQARLGSRVPVVVRVTLDAGWHVNANDPADEQLIGTALAAADKAPASLASLAYPEAIVRALGPVGDAARLHEGTFEIRAELVVPEDVPPGPRKIPLILTLQACDSASCKEPMEIRLELLLRFDAEDGPAQHPTLFDR